VGSGRRVGSSRGWRELHELDLVAFGGVNEGEDGAGGFAYRRAVRELYPFGGEVFAKGVQIFDLEGQVHEVGLDGDGAGSRGSR